MTMSGCCLGSTGCCLFSVKPLFFLRGRCVFCSFEPFTTRPVFGFICLCPSSFFVWFFRRRRVLSFFLSGAGEPQTFLVWVSPCVFAATISHYDPYFEDATYTKVFLFLFLVFVPAAPGLSPVFGHASFPSRVLSGCHSGPRAFWRFLDSLGTLGGLRLLAPFWALFFWMRGGKGASLLFVPGFCFPLFVLLCGCTISLEARVGAPRRSAGDRVITRPSGK